jgi:hypothetical protein
MGDTSETSPAQQVESTKELAKEVHWITHATFWSQVGLGLIGIVALVIYHGQLAEMQTTTDLTHQSVELAHDALDYNGSQFDRSMDQTIRQTALQYKVTEEAIVSAEAARKAADTAKEALISSNRPWLGVDGQVVVEGDPAFTDTPQGLSMTIPRISFQVRNFGTSPALNASVYVTPFIESSSGRTSKQILDDFARGAVAACRMADLGAISLPDNPTIPFGQSIFPGTPAREMWGDTAYTDPSLSRDVKPQFIGCIRYKDEFSNTLIHHTKFCAMGHDWKAPLFACPMGQSAD